jgi:2-C-methyl-D-erythritol 4-phosphate cytidylyltransferase
MSRVAVILPAAGKSSRFHDREKKPFVTLEGRPVWLRTAELFVTRDDVAQVYVVVSPDDDEMFRRRYAANLAFLNVKIVQGGKERFESVANALALVGDDVDLVAVHDAVRPCVTKEQIDLVFAKAAETGAALLGMPVAETLKRATKQFTVQETVAREGLWLAQTPQVFRRDWLLAAYAQRASFKGTITDDAQLIEAAGHAVHLVAGAATNIKITTRDDLPLAAAILASLPKPKEKRPIHPFADEASW